jgi:hypothetical protein
MNIWSFIRSDMVREWILKKEKEKKKPVKLKKLQQKHKRYMASKVNYMQKKDIKKKLK